MTETAEQKLIAKLLWIIHVAQQDLREGAPERAASFLEHHVEIADDVYGSALRLAG